MDDQMKKIGRQMAIRMGILMSFCLSLVGTLTSGHFTIPGFVVSFIISSVISLIICLVIPVGKITFVLCNKLGLKRETIGARVFESLISDIIFTPVMTFAMVGLAYFMALKQSGGMAQISFGPMFLKSLFICFVVGFFLIFIFQPMFLKHLMKKNGITNPKE
ncbi:hypothetical protein [Butyrivibrio sp. JL13D10]|uniref:hypothetical protein n=1 Tax=Butyrivibrio sp. JL13D10 TaxID=3236815 RepID=UPI0038B594CA